jgi:hypothetical protein
MGKNDKKRTNNAQRGNAKANRTAKPKVATRTITLVDLFMDIMRPPRTGTPTIDEARHGSS